MAESIHMVWDSLWGANPLAGRLIVLVILGVVAKAAYEARRNLNRYRREEREIRRVSTFLAEWRAEGSVSEEPQAEATAPGAVVVEAGAEAQTQEASNEEQPEDGGAPPVPSNPGDAPSPDPPSEVEPRSEAAGTDRHRSGLIDLDRLLISVVPTSLIGDRLQTIVRMRRHSAEVDLDALQKLALYKDAATKGQGFPAFATGLSMMLGILGTFIGLAAMVQEIHLGLPTDTASLTLESWMASVQQLGTVLGGMKTAFSTSLVGMAGAIACSAAAFQLAHRRRRVFEALERLTAAELIPSTIPPAEGKALLAQVSQRLDDSFYRLDEIFRQNQEALADLTAAQQSCVALVDEVRAITRGQAAQNLDAVLGQVARANEAVLEVARQIPGIVKAFETSARDIREGASQLRWPAPSARSGDGVILGLRPIAWLAILVALAAALSLVRTLDAL